MVEKSTVVKLKTGLQARPAALFVQEANRFSSDVTLKYKGREVSAKSIMGVMSLAIPVGAEITIRAEGSDEKDAVESLSKFVGKED
jgi:Phosphotransferase System HPr (HPr) Family